MRTASGRPNEHSALTLPLRPPLWPWRGKRSPCTFHCLPALSLTLPLPPPLWPWSVKGSPCAIHCLLALSLAAPLSVCLCSVKRSPWKGGKGDVVGEVAVAARRGGVRFGVYLSPWDRHDPSYADISKYNEHYMGQLRELLTQYVTSLNPKP